jgi:hypothetical protein
MGPSTATTAGRSGTRGETRSYVVYIRGYKVGKYGKSVIRGKCRKEGGVSMGADAVGVGAKVVMEL